MTLVALAVGGVFGYVNAHRLDVNRQLVAHTHEVIASLDRLLSTVKDAETGQRGYLLTGDAKYLTPYEGALTSASTELATLETLVADNPEQQDRLRALSTKTTARLAELTQTVDLMRRGERTAALDTIRSDAGKALMDEVRNDVAIMEGTESELLKARDQQTADSYRATVASIVVPRIAGVFLIVLLGYLFHRNLTDAQKAAAVLAAEKERLRTTLASIGDAVISTGLDGRVEYLNPVAEALTGWSTEEAAGLPLPEVFRIINESTRLPVANPAIQALKDGVIVGLSNHTVLIGKDGVERPIDDSAAPIRNSARDMIGCVLVFRDVTSRRQAEQQVLEREERFRRTLTEVAIPTILHADDDEILLVNRAWTELTGYRHEDIPTIRAWTERAYGERHAFVKEYIDDLFHAPERVDNEEWEVTTSTGDTRLWHFFSTPVGQDAGGRRLIVSNAIDITEQRRAEDALRTSEERLRMAQRVSRIGTFDWNVQTDVNTWTPELEAMYGLAPGEFAGTLKTWEHLVHPEDRPHAMRSVNDALANGDFSDEWRVVWPDGSEHWLAGRGLLFKDDLGQPLRLLGINIDITERRQNEQELRRLAAELSEADRRKDEFLATLAHELRNPLAPIRTGLEILQRSTDGDTREQVLTMIGRQTVHLVRLVDDLMDVSRITRGTLELRRERVELATIVHHALETARPIIASRGHELTVVSLDTPAFVDADSTRLAQVFANLLNNAARYSDRGGRIWLSVTQQDRQFTVSVRDAGIGIPPDMLSRIFEMFTQVDRRLEKSHAGLGIGLTLAKRLVDMHGGTIEARSDGADRGSEFIVRLPVAQSVHPRPDTPGNDTDQSPATPCRILVADDNEDSVTTMDMMLSRVGHQVRTAPDGLEAVRVAVEFEPDVIILDIGMPNLSGYEACRLIRKQTFAQRALIIALSGWGTQDDKQRSREAGFDYHLVKPVDPRTLEQLLAQRCQPRS